MDNKELEKIYNDTYRSVYWTAMSLLKDEEDAQDIVQETYVTLIDSYDTLKDREKVAAWLKKIAANKCLDRLRRTKTVNAEDDFFENVEAQPEDFLPDSILESAEKRRIIMDIIDNALSEDIRRTLILYYYDEMTTKEIASLLGIPQGTVLWRLNFAKKKIKKEVEKYEEENNDKLYAMAAVPFLSKLFAKEAEQVPLKPIAAPLLTLSASADVPAKAAAAKAASSAATKGIAGLTLNKIIIAVVAFILAVVAAVVVIPKIINDTEETTEETTIAETEESEDAVTDGTSDDASDTEPTEDLSVVLVGTWVRTSSSDNTTEYVLFGDDGTLEIRKIDDNGVEVARTSGSYTVDGNNMTTSLADGTVFDTITVTVDGDTLTLESPDYPDGTLVYTRQDETVADQSASAGNASEDPASALIGTWMAEERNDIIYITFSEDGTVEYVMYTLAGVETDRMTVLYTVDGDEMNWFDEAGNNSVFLTYSCDGDTLSLTPVDFPDEPLVLTRSTPFETADYTVADVAGTWVSYDNSYLGDSAEGYIPIDLYWVFNEDGTVSYYGIDSNGEEHDVMSGTYTVAGNELTITTSAGEPTMLVIRIDGDTMTMGGLGPADTYMTLTRQA
ncbi:MAG: sigma-70 family RNA polymerase sigma factor [Saccharofermentans sp.]|nr:sigma-70 family RNA polymerase sigma factor [Saccharofermentans sp.]